jgi:hypothetical protein
MDDRLRQYGWHSFENWPESEVHDYLTTKCGIIHARQLPDGSWAGLMQLLYTLSVCMGISPTDSYQYRWCFEDPAEAVHLYKTAVEFDEIPDRRESLVGHRHSTGTPLYVEFDLLGLPKWR